MGKTLKILSLTAGVTALSMAMAGTAAAEGTAAGTNVQNTFTLDYQVGGVDQPTIDTGPGGTNTPTEFTVDRLVDLTVASNGDNTVAPGATDEQLVFSVTNNGNDTQGYVLSLVNEAGDDFDASGLTITYYFESGDSVGFDANDTAGTAYTYTPGSGLATEDLPADAIIWVVVEGDIPTSGSVSDGDTADVTLVADTVEAGSPGVAGVPVTADTDGNDLGTAENVLADGSGTANEGANAGDHSATGTYIVAAATLNASKTVTVFSEDGTGCATIPGTASGGYAVPGACMEYVISVTNTGATASATGIDLTDVLADEFTFVAAARSAQLTGGTFSTPATNADCVSGACTVSLTGASLAAGQTGTVTIRVEVK